MITLRAGNFIDEDKLDKKEAIHFIAFLEEEKWRHILAMRAADENRYACASIPVLKLAYETSVTRHIEDIQHTQRTIDKLVKKYNLTVKDMIGV